MRSWNTPRLNWFGLTAKSNWNRRLQRLRMRFNVHLNCLMKFSTSAELMHAEIPNDSSVLPATGKFLAPSFQKWSPIVCVLIWLLAVGCSKETGEKSAPAPAEKKEESRVTRGTNGETIIKLDA